MKRRGEAFAREFRRQLIRQGILSILRRRLGDLGWGLFLLGTTTFSVALLTTLWPLPPVSPATVFFYGGFLKLPIVLVGVFLFQRRQTLGLAVPLSYVPIDLLGALYYRQVKITIPSLIAYYHLYGSRTSALPVVALTSLLAIGGTWLGRRLDRRPHTT